MQLYCLFHLFPPAHSQIWSARTEIVCVTRAAIGESALCGAPCQQCTRTAAARLMSAALAAANDAAARFCRAVPLQRGAVAGAFALLPSRPPEVLFVALRIVR